MTGPEVMAGPVSTLPAGTPDLAAIDAGNSAHASLAASHGATPIRDTDRDDELPDVARYEGPDVADQPALINPSTGSQGPTEQGADDINPQGPAPQPGQVPTSDRQVYPDTTQDRYPR